MIALIVARPGALRDGLSGLLSAMPEITVVSTTDNLDRAIELAMEHCPSVAVLALQELDHVQLAKAELMKAACPQLKILVLVQSPQPELKIEASGVDAVLLHGAKAARITDTLSTLIRPNGREVA